MRRNPGQVALAGLCLLLAAFLFDTAPLFVAGTALLVLAVGAGAWIQLSARGVTVQRGPLPPRVVESEPVEATIEVKAGPLGAPGATLLDPLAGGPLPVRAASPVHLVARFGRRGRVVLAAPGLRLQDPLGLARIEVMGSRGAELLVLPRTEPVRWASPDGDARGRGEGLAGARQPPTVVEVDGLRPYQPGTPASRIYWAALARGADLLERRLEADVDARPLVVLDARSGGPDRQLDAAVRAAASLTLELARGGGCRLLLPDERRATAIEADLAAWPAVHARLAVVESAVRAPALPPDASLVLYVAAQPLEPAGAGVLVLPEDVLGPPGARPCLEVAGCRGYRLARTPMRRAA